MKFQLIALDVDGTVLNDAHQLTGAVQFAIRKVYSTGILVVFCTGRSPTSILPMMRELQISGPLITHNGAAIVNSTDKKIIQRYDFSINRAQPYIKYCHDHRIHFDVNTVFELYTEQLTPSACNLYADFMMVPHVVKDVARLNRPIVKMTLFSKSRLDRVEKDVAFISNDLRVIRSGKQFIDIMHPWATKGNALRNIAMINGIPRESILAIGNYYNDLDMLRYAGLGIAMGNSPEELKKQADAVTLSNNQDGVYYALKKYVFKQG